MRKNTSRPLRILVTGASSGIGYDAAAELARMGHTVFAAARRVALMEPLKEFGVTPVALDVTSEDSLKACLEVVGDLDVLVNNAGYGFFGPIETVPMEDARRQVEVNLFGLARLCQMVLPGMRAKGSGRIVNIGSVAGKAAMHFGGWYNVSKFAVEAFSDALRMEMKPFGVKVVLIEPGPIKTSWGDIAADHLAACTAGTAYEAAGAREAATMHSNVVCHEPREALFVPDNDPLRFVLARPAAGPLVGRHEPATRQPRSGQVRGETVGVQAGRLAYNSLIINHFLIHGCTRKCTRLCATR